jgi:hypothetical protein
MDGLEVLYRCRTTQIVDIWAQAAVPSLGSFAGRDVSEPMLDTGAGT